jgi:Arc/MetJ-type ribon-helix-helix transcriptional regulator
MNISLPAQMASLVREEVGTGKYGSVSEFFRELVREWTKKQAIADVRKSEEEYKQGKGKVLHSLADLR